MEKCPARERRTWHVAIGWAGADAKPRPRRDEAAAAHPATLPCGGLSMEFIRVDIAAGIAIVTLSRPPVNALSAPMMREVAGAFEELGRSENARAAILTADGDRVFCAGADVN